MRLAYGYFTDRLCRYLACVEQMYREWRGKQRRGLQTLRPVADRELEHGIQRLRIRWGRLCMFSLSFMMCLCTCDCVRGPDSSGLFAL